jgi:3-deoxy-manno-octulosonate cytidylyltransferase (CMP-KDO synthetase)
MANLAVGVIPARLASTRLPAKLLLAETGKPLIQHTWEQARLARVLSEVIVAADSPEIAQAVRAFGGRCEMTGEHPSGTDRIAELLRRGVIDAATIVNIQGDEPEIDPDHLTLLVKLLEEHPGAQMSTLATRIISIEARDSPACVKVVRAADGRALYFSRSRIPFCRDVDPDRLLAEDSPWLRHLGLYAYRREFLLWLTEQPQSRLEQLEKLEQLRAVEAGAQIQVGLVDAPAVGIDTPDDYARFVKSFLKNDGRQQDSTSGRIPAAHFRREPSRDQIESGRGGSP